MTRDSLRPNAERASCVSKAVMWEELGRWAERELLDEVVPLWEGLEDAGERCTWGQSVTTCRARRLLLVCGSRRSRL